MNSVCIFCGSRAGRKQSYVQQAKRMAEVIVEHNLRLIYGGGKVGLMGIIADEVIKNKGKVTGVIPEFLYKKEVAHEGLDKLIIVDSMHERKQKMSTLADSFVAMPGGFGTLEELAEIITWKQLELVNKPVGVLNIDNFYNSLLNYFDLMVAEGFVDIDFRTSIVASNQPGDLIVKLKAQQINGTTEKLNKT